MVSDFRQGKPTEIDQLNGEILRLAAEAGSSAPVNAAVVELLTARRANQAAMSAEQLLQRLPMTP
jgi:2-dehydropantoate 2-reductase